MSSEDCRFGDLRVRLTELAIAATLLRAHGSHFSGLLLASADAVHSLFFAYYSCECTAFPSRWEKVKSGRD